MNSRRPKHVPHIVEGKHANHFDEKICPQVEFVFACYDVGGRSRLSMSELFLLLKSTTAGLCKLSGTEAPDSARFESVASLVSVLPGRGGGERTRYRHKIPLACAHLTTCLVPSVTGNRPPPTATGFSEVAPRATRHRFEIIHICALTAAAYNTELQPMCHTLCRKESTVTPSGLACSPPTDGVGVLLC